MLEQKYSLSMAIFDFVPVFGFLTGAIFLSRIFFLPHKRRFGWMMIFGGMMIFLGGALQASWKLLMCLNLPAFGWMSQGQFVFMGFGYLALFLPTTSLLKRAREAELTPLSAMAAWKIPFLLVMTLASLGTYGILAYIALRRLLWVAALGFMLAFVGVILMGSMANQVQTIKMQWIEQSINSSANLGFALGCFLLYKDFKQKLPI